MLLYRIVPNIQGTGAVCKNMLLVATSRRNWDELTWFVRIFFCMSSSSNSYSQTQFHLRNESERMHHFQNETLANIVHMLMRCWRQRRRCFAFDALMSVSPPPSSASTPCLLILFFVVSCCFASKTCCFTTGTTTPRITSVIRSVVVVIGFRYVAPHCRTH